MLTQDKLELIKTRSMLRGVEALNEVGRKASSRISLVSMLGIAAVLVSPMPWKLLWLALQIIASVGLVISSNRAYRRVTDRELEFLDAELREYGYFPVEPEP